MRYEAEAQKNILKYQYKNLCGKYKLEAAISSIAENMSLLFDKYSLATRKMLIDHLAHTRQSFVMNWDKWPLFIKTLYYLAAGDREFITSHFDIDCTDKVGKERKKHIQGFINSVKSITFGHLVAIDVQMCKEEFYKAKKAEKITEKEALTRHGIFGENGKSAIENGALLENIAEEKEEAVDQSDSLIGIKQAIGQGKENKDPTVNNKMQVK
jgi:hypothetical protein